MPTLFDIAVPFRASSPPQVEGAEKVVPHAGKQARRILEVLKIAGPLTAEEIVEETGIRRCAVCGRLREMECPGRALHFMREVQPLVKKVGRKPARSGVHVYIYDLTPAGRQA